MATVYRREGSPFWFFDITVEGKRKRLSTKRKLKKEAEAFAEKYRRDLLDRVQLGQGIQEITLRDALWDHYLPGKLTNPRYKEYVHICKKVCGDVEGISGLGGDTLMSELTNSALKLWRRRREAEGAAAQTIDHELKPVSAAYRLVASDFKVKAALEFPMKRPKGIARYLSDEEVEALIRELDPKRPIKGRKSAKNPQLPEPTYYLDPFAQLYRQKVDNLDLVIMLLYTGCRFGEIASLTWDMVDTIDFKWIRIFRTKVEGTSRDNDMLAMHPRMKEVLQRRFQARRNTPYVFAGWIDRDDGKDAPRASTAAIRRAMARIGINAPDKVKRFGRRDVRSLRDTFATRLRMKGMALDNIQELLGHASPVMSQKYANLTINRASLNALELLD